MGNCLCNFFDDNQCLIWVIIAVLVALSLTNGGCGCNSGCGTPAYRCGYDGGNCGCGCGCN